MPRPRFKMPDSVLLSFARGFWITFWNMMPWKRTTIQYPEAVRPQPAIFRGRHRLQRYEDGLERCVGCALCAAVCPSEAIYLEAAENTEENRVSPGERYAKLYEIHQLRCIFCGFCEEACPEDAIVMGPEWELANYARKRFIASKEDMLTPKEEGFGKPPRH
jgi:NADH-quinone oxidoreductase subunit I